MVETRASFELDFFIDKNEDEFLEFVGFISHKTNTDVYGGLFKTKKGLVFQQHKSANGSVLFVHKYVTQDLWNSFEKISDERFIGMSALNWL